MAMRSSGGFWRASGQRDADENTLIIVEASAETDFSVSGYLGFELMRERDTVRTGMYW